MKATPPAYDEWRTQPSIIIDPSIFVAEPGHETFRARALGALGTMLRATLAGLVISVTVFAITLTGSWLSRGAQHETPALLSALLHPSRAEAAHVVLRKGAPDPVKRQILPAMPAREVKAPMDAQLGGVSSIAQARMEEPASGPEQIVEIEKIDVDVLLRSGRKQLAQRRPELAEETFRAVLAERPSHPGALSGIARAKLARGDVDAALGFAHRAVLAAPSRAIYHAVLGEVLSALGESAAADLEYESASRLSQGKLDRTRAILPPNPYESAKEELADGTMVATP